MNPDGLKSGNPDWKDPLKTWNTLKFYFLNVKWDRCIVFFALTKLSERKIPLRNWVPSSAGLRQGQVQVLATRVSFPISSSFSVASHLCASRIIAVMFLEDCTAYKCSPSDFFLEDVLKILKNFKNLWFWEVVMSEKAKYSSLPSCMVQEFFLMVLG